MTDSYIVINIIKHIYYSYIYTPYHICAPLPFMMFDRPEVILIFSIALECFCMRMKLYDAHSVTRLSNCIITDACGSARIVVLLLLLQ